MVIDPNDPNSKSVGSFFKNPVVSIEKLEQLQRRFGQVPYFEFGDEAKIPAAWLIGEAGFRKGHVSGKAGISANHNLALINLGGARAADIVALESEIREAVASRIDIGLVPEPVFVGF
jgi:UDP-N-acetylmuramate dehydrogenase